MGLISILCFAILMVACVEDDIHRGNEALLIGDYQRAVDNFSKALDRDPANRDARYGLALSYYSMAEDEELLHVPTFDLWSRTAKEFKILSKIDSSEQVKGNYSTCLFYLARATMAKGEGTNVLPILEKSLQLDSLNYFSLNLKGLILGNDDDSLNVAAAKNIFIHLLTQEPQFISAYVNLGNIYWNSGDVESAWDIWSLGLEKFPQDKALVHWTQVAEDSLKRKVLVGEL